MNLTQTQMKSKQYDFSLFTSLYLISNPTRVTDHSATVIDNIF